MRKYRLHFGLALAAMLFSFALLMPAARAAQTLDRVVAVVNDGIILQSELDTAIARIRSQISSQGEQMPPRSVLVKQVLNHLVMQKIQLQQAKKRNISVGHQALAKAIGEIAQNNGMSTQQFLSTLSSQGIDPQAFRKEVRDELTIKELQRQEIQHSVSVTPRDVTLYLQNEAHSSNAHASYHLLHILIAVPGNATKSQVAKLKSKADEIAKKLKNGGDFQSTAMRVSNGQQALKGGDLGWIKAGALPTLFASVVPRMHTGDVAGPLRSPSGFHIIKLVGERNAGQTVTEVHVRHILLSPGPQRSSAKTHQLAEKLYKELKNGASFSELARVYSDDPGSAKKGGDLGWQTLGSFVKPFSEAVSKLQKGQISKPFKTPFGWHIAQLLGKRQHKISQKMRRRQARQAIGERKAREQYANWLRRMRAEAYVKYMIPVGSPGSA